MTTKQLRHTAHLYFDPLWLKPSYEKKQRIRRWRTRKYKWLARRLKIPLEDCHISRFNKELCIKTINICANQYAENENLILFFEKLERKEVLTWFSFDKYAQ